MRFYTKRKKVSFCLAKRDIG